MDCGMELGGQGSGGANFVETSSIVVGGLELREHGARSAEARGARFSIPPFYGRINSIEGQSAERLLDVVGQTAKSIAKSESSIVGSEHFGLFEPCLRV